MPTLVTTPKGSAFIKAFDVDIDEFPPIAIDEVKNVWLFHLMLDDDMLDLHIIQTDVHPI